MKRWADSRGRGFFGIGVYRPKTESNVGTLWRGAFQLGADFLFTVGRRYQRESSDTVKAWRHVPLFHHMDLACLLAHQPLDCPLIAVEMGGVPLHNYWHPERCVYLLGAEDGGLPKQVLDRCHGCVSIGAIRTASYNVAQAGTLVMYERARQRGELAVGREALNPEAVTGSVGEGVGGA